MSIVSGQTRQAVEIGPEPSEENHGGRRPLAGALRALASADRQEQLSGAQWLTAATRALTKIVAGRGLQAATAKRLLATLQAGR